MKNINLNSKTIRGLNFTGEHLNASYMNLAVFSNCCFRSAILNESMISASTFIDCDFTNARLELTNMSNTSFTRCLMNRSVIKYATVKNTTFTDSTYKNYTINPMISVLYNAGDLATFVMGKKGIATPFIDWRGPKRAEILQFISELGEY